MWSCSAPTLPRPTNWPSESHRPHGPTDALGRCQPGCVKCVTKILTFRTQTFHGILKLHCWHNSVNTKFRFNNKFNQFHIFHSNGVFQLLQPDRSYVNSLGVMDRSSQLCSAQNQAPWAVQKHNDRRFVFPTWNIWTSLNVQFVEKHPQLLNNKSLKPCRQTLDQILHDDLWIPMAVHQNADSYPSDSPTWGPRGKGTKASRVGA